jgi:hypothetical protein
MVAHATTMVEEMQEQLLVREEELTRGRKPSP